MKEYQELQKPIIFIGAARSGTTIFSEIIMRHPDLAFPSNYQEMFFRYPAANLIRNVFDNRYLRILGQKKQLNKVSRFNKFIFKTKESYKMWRYLTGEDINFSRDFLIGQQASPERIDFIRDYFSRMVRYQNRKRLTFKITGPSRISYLTSIFPDAMFINLKRRKLPTINSLIHVDFWGSRGIDRLWWTGAYTQEEKEWVLKHADQPALVTAFQLKRIDEVTEQELREFQPDYIEVNYEDFVADPKSELQKVVDFTGLEEFDLDRHLKGVQIHNRNKKDQEYFSNQQLKAIYELLEAEPSLK